MFFSPSFSYLPLLVTVALVSCCIKAPAQIPPPSPFCTILSANSSLLSKKEPLSDIDEYGRNLTLFSQSSFALPGDLSSPSTSLTFTFTTSYGTEGPRGELSGPRLAFILARYPLLATAPSSVQFMELSFLCNRDRGGCAIHSKFCSKQGPQVRVSTVYNEDDEDLLEDEVSLSYDASTAELFVHVVDYREGFKNNLTFIWSTDADFLPNSTLSSDESTTLFVGYITLVSSTPTSLSHKDDAKTNNETHTKHIKVVAWVVVGTLGMGTLLGLIILVIFIKKRHRRRPVVSSPILGHGSTPLVRRSPFTHHDLESTVTPMMSAPPFPPIHSNAFQISGTASWLKQPNPR